MFRILKITEYYCYSSLSLTDIVKLNVTNKLIFFVIFCFIEYDLIFGV